ncbi:nucleoside-diphosphate kinase [Candidatus Microgenomates bacterium]|nr:nucleoside-diphosphate kinase [Candidatus Microgenomates bacterium]
MEQTLIVIKPDGVVRGLTGEIITRFEKAGLKMVAAKMLMVTKEHASKHYPADREELWTGIGNKTLDNYKALELDAIKLLGTDDPKKIGDIVRVWLLDYIASGPVYAAVFEGPHAVELIRKICGHTLPLLSAPGTIRGDYSFDSAYLANKGQRAIKNLIHASGTLEEAKYEIPLWFGPKEIQKYKRTDENIMA